MKSSILSLFLFAALAVGCSTDAPAPVNPNPLTLSLIDAHRPGALGLFTLGVSMNSRPLRGAKLTMRILPQDVTTTLKNVGSDSTGTFKFTVTWSDTTQGVQFQALYDSLFGTIDSTLKSNVVSWAP